MKSNRIFNARLHVGENHRQSMSALVLLRTSSAPIRVRQEPRKNKLIKTPPKASQEHTRLNGLSAILQLCRGFCILVVDWGTSDTCQIDYQINKGAEVLSDLGIPCPQHGTCGGLDGHRRLRPAGNRSGQ